MVHMVYMVKRSIAQPCSLALLQVLAAAVAPGQLYTNNQHI